MPCCRACRRCRSCTTSFTCVRGCGIALVRNHQAAQSDLVGGGIVYLLLFAYGLIIDDTSEANLVPLNNADNWLHLVLGIGIGMGHVLGLALGRRPMDDGVDRATTF